MATNLFDLKENVSKSHGKLSNLKNKMLNAIDDFKSVYLALTEKVKILEGDKYKLHEIAHRKSTYADVVTEAVQKRVVEQTENEVFKIIVESTDKNTDGEKVKHMLKKKIDPSKIKVAIKSLKLIKNEKVIIIANNKKDRDKLCSAINETYNGEVRANPCTKYWPRLCVMDIPDEVTMENASEIICSKNFE